MRILIRGYQEGALMSFMAKDGVYSVIETDEDPELLLYNYNVVKILDVSEPEGLKRLRDRLGDPPYRYLAIYIGDLRDIKSLLRELEGIYEDIKFIFPRLYSNKFWELYFRLREEIDTLDRYVLICPHIRPSREFIEKSDKLRCVRFDSDERMIRFYKRLRSRIVIPEITELKNSTCSGIATIYAYLGAPIVGFKTNIDSRLCPDAAKPALIYRIPPRINGKYTGCIK
jgi:hypothetical protein